MSQKKRYGVADHQCFLKHWWKNARSNVIFSDMINTTFNKLCVEFQLHMSIITKVMNARELNWWFNPDLMIKRQIETKHILSSKSHLTHHSSHVCNFSYLWHVGLKLHIQLHKSCVYRVSKYCIVILHHATPCFFFFFFFRNKVQVIG